MAWWSSSTTRASGCDTQRPCAVASVAAQVDIGIPERGLLEVPQDLKGEFRCGDSVQGMRVEDGSLRKAIIWNEEVCDM